MINFIRNLFDIEDVLIPLILSILVFVLLKVFNIYSNIDIYYEPIRNLLLAIASALIGFAGIILAGIAIVISMLNREIIDAIEKINYKGILDPIFQSYKVLMLITISLVITFYTVYFLLFIESKIINESIFLSTTTLLSFLFFFLLLYVYGIVRSCIGLFNVTNIYREAKAQEEMFKQEVRKNIIKFIADNNFGTIEEYKANLIHIIKSEFNEKEASKRIKIVNELLL